MRSQEAANRNLVHGASPSTPGASFDRFAPDLAPRLANGILIVVFCALVTVAFLSLLAAGFDTRQVVLGGTYLFMLLALQLGYVSWPRARLRPRVTYPTLALQAALVYAPVLQFGETWIGLPGLLVGSVLLTLRPSVSWPVAAAIVASLGGLGMWFGRSPVATLHLLISVIITGLVAYGLTRLARLVTELHAARDELARLAVAEERLRVARDVHDFLGLSLSAITLKSELTNRLISEYPERAQEQLAEVLDISRRAQADARAVASPDRELSLDHECRSARSALTAAEIDVRIERDSSEFSRPVGTVLATVLREGATNVLRHSKAEWCEIAVGTAEGLAQIDIVNDGLAPGHRGTSSSQGDGSGIRNLSHRVRELGGELTAGADPDSGTYRMRVMIPLGGPH